MGIRSATGLVPWFSGGKVSQGSLWGCSGRSSTYLKHHGYARRDPDVFQYGLRLGSKLWVPYILVYTGDLSWYLGRWSCCGFF